MHADPRDCISLEDESYRDAILHSRLAAGVLPSMPSSHRAKQLVWLLVFVAVSCKRVDPLMVQGMRLASAKTISWKPTALSHHKKLSMGLDIFVTGPPLRV